MFLPQTLKEFLDNPMGKGSTAISNRKLITEDLKRRYYELIKKKKITIFPYKDGDEYYFHFKIPSESERENNYDVVLRFTMLEDNFKYDNFLNRYYLQFFSNSPSFTYTFAYVFNDYQLLIPLLSNKYKDIVLSNNPLVKNPGEIINYEKSIFFACFYLTENSKYLNKMLLNPSCKPFIGSHFIKTIRNTDTIDLEIKKENNRLTKIKNNVKEEDKKDKTKENKQHNMQTNQKVQVVQSQIKRISSNTSDVGKVNVIHKKKKITPR